jgi:C1A family cysteine protease
MAVVGYDDEKHAFRVANSWSSRWGDNGFLWISEDYVAKDTLEAWGFAPTGIRARALTQGHHKIYDYGFLQIEQPDAAGSR